jgi:hypothetical protein
MKAECGKTARSVWAADGGEPFNGRLLRPDSDEGAVMGLEQRGRIRWSYFRNNWRQDDVGGYDRQAV